MNKKTEFWAKKRVLVTGGNGFVAAHLIRALLEKDAQVVSLVRRKENPNIFELISGRQGCNGQYEFDTEVCDLRNLEQFRHICEVRQIDTIFHLAASTIVSDAARSPVVTVENNILGTLNVLEVSRINGIPRVLLASSDKAYGDHADDLLESLPYREDYALRGLDIYSATKASADVLAQVYAYQFHVPVMIARACNIFGPGDMHLSRLIPKTVYSLLLGRAPQIFPDAEEVLREYMYVEDVVAAYLLLMEHIEDYYGLHHCNLPRWGRKIYGWMSFNIGSYTPDEQKNLSSCHNIKNTRQIMELLQLMIGGPPPIIGERPANAIQIPDQYLDASKIRSFGFRPQVFLEDGIIGTVSWYKAQQKYLTKRSLQYI